MFILRVGMFVPTKDRRAEDENSRPGEDTLVADLWLQDTTTTSQSSNSCPISHNVVAYLSGSGRRTFLREGFRR